MSVTQEDLQYLPYLDRNLGRIFTRDCKPNIRLFIDEFKASDFGSRLVAEGLATPEHLDQILAETQQRFGHDDVSMSEYVRTAKSMWMNGDLEPEQQSVEEPPAEPELTASQRAWQEYRIFTESHSVAECKARARVDEGYRSFLNKNLQREMATGVGDAAENLLDRPKPSTKKASEDVRMFAEDYRSMSTAQLKSLLSPASVGTEVATHYQKLFDQATELGLI
jgi:hypothetical protein